MPYDELQGWIAYFNQRPPNWQLDLCTFKLLQAQGVKGKPWDHFPSLKIIFNPELSDSERIRGSLKRSAIFQKMLQARGGDQLKVLNEL